MSTLSLACESQNQGILDFAFPPSTGHSQCSTHRFLLKQLKSSILTTTHNNAPPSLSLRIQVKFNAVVHRPLSNLTSLSLSDHTSVHFLSCPVSSGHTGRLETHGTRNKNVPTSGSSYLVVPQPGILTPQVS